MVLKQFIEKLHFHPRLDFSRSLMAHPPDSENPQERAELKLTVQTIKASPTDIAKLKKDWEALVAKGPWESLRDNFSKPDGNKITLSAFTLYKDRKVLEEAYYHLKR